MSRELPEGWRLVRLSEIAEVRLGRQRSPARATGPNMRPYMRAANVGWNGLRLDDVKEMDFSPEEFATYALQPGDVLVGEASGSRDEVGKSALWRGEVPGACFQNTLIRVRVNRALAAPEFVQLCLQHDASRGALAEISKGVGIHHLGRDGLASWEIPLPPLDEQRRIVAKLDALRARSRRAKEALDAVPGLLERLRQSILAAAFRGDLTADWRAANPDVEPASELLKRIRIERRKRWEEAELAKMVAKGKPPKDDRWKAKYVEPEPVDESELPELPEGWCWATLREIALLKGGITKGQKRAEGVGLRAVPYLRVANVQRGYLALDEIAMIEATQEEIAELALRPGDLLFNEGGDRDKLGRGWVWEGQIAECIHQNHVFRGRVVSAEVEPRLISHYANSIGQTYFVREGAQTTNLASISITKLGALPVPLIPVAEQSVLLGSLSRALEAIPSLGAARSSCSENLSSLDSAILAAAFRGELVSRHEVSADEAAAES